VAVFVHIEINNRFMARLLRGPASPVAKNMLLRGRRVRDAARRNVNSRTGTLARSIEVSIAPRGDGNGAQVGTSLFYAKFVHDGTGIYGPTGQVIRPRGTSRVLVFDGRGGETFTRYSRGQRGTKFLIRALRAAG
jgi:hypothetical protein